MWKALYHLEGGYWRVLATEDIGFITASQGFNRGEVYTADGIHPILPLSGFDKGYLLIDGVWRIWDTRYSAQTFVNADPPYQVDIIRQFYWFNIHSPIVFIPLVLKNARMLYTATAAPLSLADGRKFTSAHRALGWRSRSVRGSGRANLARLSSRASFSFPHQRQIDPVGARH
jgi:hypothetical protein